MAHNALRTQSHKHPHGWGIAWYDASGVQIRRGIAPAHADEAFVAAAHAAREGIVLAHVRDASVGSISHANTHPFAHGRWLFAHNGTVTHFKDTARIRAEIEAEIDVRFRSAISGETDSERCFYLFLSRLSSRLQRGEPLRLEATRAALAETVAIITRITDVPGETPSSLNMMATDGALLVACRHGRSLHMATGGFFAVASEPIGLRPWRELPDESFVGIDTSQRILASALLA